MVSVYLPCFKETLVFSLFHYVIIFDLQIYDYNILHWWIQPLISHKLRKIILFLNIFVKE